MIMLVGSNSEIIIICLYFHTTFYCRTVLASLSSSSLSIIKNRVRFQRLSFLTLDIFFCYENGALNVMNT
uniref:Uncharacterized protein n=1 Tax=Onchocerca volvulus TaxID=6282 RepID=A0A8R1TPT0_ONCVO